MRIEVLPLRCWYAAVPTVCRGIAAVYHPRRDINNQSCYTAIMKSRQQGLTLIELMVTLAVAIVLVAVGMPLFTGVAANNRATTQSNSLLAAVRLARSEALRRSTDVSLCPTANPTAASPTCTGNTNDWNGGWTVYYVDSATATTEHIRIQQALDGNPTITSDTSPVIRFDSTGAAALPVANLPWSVSLSFAETTGVQSRCISVNNAGQIRMRRYDPGNGETCP